MRPRIRLEKPSGALKMQDRKMRDQMSGVENAGSENAGTHRNAANLLVR